MLSHIKSAYRCFRVGERYLNDPRHRDGMAKSAAEYAKRPTRTEVLNYLLEASGRRCGAAETRYLEIGVRNPAENFDGVRATVKFGVDPGVEFRENPVAFPMTSDVFFDGLASGQHLSPDYTFHVIFIAGLHLADQVNRDIRNSLHHVHERGFVVLHDCNPPTEWHARDSYDYAWSPAKSEWNGSTWKAFVKWRTEPSVKSCCIDTDWGLGVLTRGFAIGDAVAPHNEFFEYTQLQQDRRRSLGLVGYEEFRRLVESSP